MNESIGHHIITQFAYTNKNLFEICSKIEEPHPNLLKIILSLTEAYYKDVDPQPAFEQAESYSFVKGDDVVLYLIFITIWCALCLQNGKIVQAEILLAQAYEIFNKKLPIELKWSMKGIEGMIFRCRKDLINEQKILGELVEETPRQGAIFSRSVSAYLGCLSFNGDYAQFRKVLNQLKSERSRDEILDAMCTYNEFRFDLRQGRIEEAQNNHLPKVINILGILKNNGYPRIERDMQFWLQLLDILHKRDPLTTIHKLNLPFKNTPYHDLRSFQALLNRDPAAALLFATAYWNETKDDLSYVLIRAQLANRNFQTAKDLITKRQKKCGSSYIDHFFMAKVSLMEGDSRQAHANFSKSLQYAQRYGCLSRIKLELALSCELHPEEVFDFMFPSGVDKKVVSKDINFDQQVQQVQVLSLNKSRLPYLVGSGKWYEELTHKIRIFASSKNPVLVVGETGTGKELVARALHDHSARRDQSYLSINCGALSSSLLQSELFGHVKGAFTGAERRHKGVFEEVGEGTLFLDEMGDAPHEIQTALLRVLESGEYKPIGSSVLKKTNCCLVFATNVDLKQAVVEGRFRKDLYYRLNQLLLTIPPLRERREDIMLLAKHFLSLDHPQSGKVMLTDELSEILNHYTWPGNVRELRNEVEYMKLMNRDKVIYGINDLRPDFFQLMLNQTDQPLASSESRSESSFSQEKSSDLILAVNEKAQPHSNDLPQIIPSSNRITPFVSATSSWEIKNSKERRYDQLRELFKEHQKLSRANICELLGVSPATATTYLKKLCDNNYVKKVMPTKSPRTHYFRYSGEAVF